MIRKATKKDFLTIYKFINDLENSKFDKAIQLKVYLKNIRAPNNLYLVIEIKGEIIGYISCHSQRLLHHGGELIGEIQEFFIKKEYRKRGLGTKLLDYLIFEIKQKGITQLEVTSNIKRIQTHKFYEHTGFQLTHKKFTNLIYERKIV